MGGRRPCGGAETGRPRGGQGGPREEDGQWGVGRGLRRVAQATKERRGGRPGTGGQTHLQDEDEVVGRLVSSVQVMTDVVLVVLVKLELLDDVWVLEQPQQDLL